MVWGFSFHTTCGDGLSQVLFAFHKEAYFSDVFRGRWPYLLAGDLPSDGGNLQVCPVQRVMEKAKTYTRK